MSDYNYDRIVKDLVFLMSECENVSDSTYYYAFYDFDGSTGYHLYSRLTEKDRDYLTSIVRLDIALRSEK